MRFVCVKQGQPQLRGRRKEEKTEKEELGMSDWKKTAQRIAQEAWAEYGNNEDGAIELIEERIDSCPDVIYTASAYEIVCDTRIYDYKTFEAANIMLQDTEGDRIYKDETIDNVIVRLAYCILYTQAMDYYWELVNKNKEEAIADD